MPRVPPYDLKMWNCPARQGCGVSYSLFLGALTVVDMSCSIAILGRSITTVRCADGIEIVLTGLRAGRYTLTSGKSDKGVDRVWV
jgi:hypothetical protein